MLRPAISCLESLEVEQLSVQQVRSAHIAQRAQDGFYAPGVLLLPLPEQLAHLAALQVLLRAAQVAGNDGEALFLRIGRKVVLPHIGERSNDDVPAVVRPELGRHGLQLAAEEQVEKERSQDVVAVVAEGDLGRTEFARDAV